MSDVVFVDTSVLLNLLDVPHKNSDRDAVRNEFKRLVANRCLLIIPIAAVVEVGNHVAQLPGHLARERATQLANFLRRSISGQPPWVVSGARWDTDYLQALVEGNDRLGLVDFATQGIGSGDASILLEIDRYRARTDLPSGQPVRLWTLDASLAAHS